MQNQNNSDEETPLLRTPVKSTPLPWGQFSLVLLLQLAEPLTSQIIYPFAPQLVRDVGITGGDEKKVGYYVGVMESLFFLTQAMTILHWSRASDRVGRKPVILSGLAGLAISMYSFGLSRTFWGLVFSRGLNGALNGNIGVVKSMMAELTDSTNIAQAFAYMPIAWSTGSALGPIIGGSLARPAERFPHYFGNSEFHKKYPYFLPCAVPATFTVIAWTAAFFYLKETVASPRPIFSWKKKNTAPGTLPLGENPLTLRQLLTPRVLIAASNYAALAFVDISFRAIQPLFLSTPQELGGLGVSLPSIGAALSLYGILNGICQVCFFARLCKRFGAKRVYIAGVAGALPLFASFPLLAWAGRHYGIGVVVLVGILAQTMLAIGISMSYGAIFIFVAAAAPSRAVLGATNGLAQVTVSVMRAIGPACAGALYSLSVERGWLGGLFVYVVLSGVVLGAVGVGSLLPSAVWEVE